MFLQQIMDVIQVVRTAFAPLSIGMMTHSVVIAAIVEFPDVEFLLRLRLVLNLLGTRMSERVQRRIQVFPCAMFH
jgi:hypothetical protein